MFLLQFETESRTETCRPKSEKKEEGEAGRTHGAWKSNTAGMMAHTPGLGFLVQSKEVMFVPIKQYRD